jgi:hypothetical protein
MITLKPLLLLVTLSACVHLSAGCGKDAVDKGLAD